MDLLSIQPRKRIRTIVNSATPDGEKATKLLHRKSYMHMAILAISQYESMRSPARTIR